MTSIPLFALSVLGTGFANNIVALLFLRFLAGLFGAPSVSIGSASVSDMVRYKVFCYLCVNFYRPNQGSLYMHITSTQLWGSVLMVL